MKPIALFAPVALLAACGSPSPAPLGTTAQAATATDDTIEVLTWSSATNVFPAALGYTPTHDYDADFCELFVNGFGQGNFSADGTTVAWLEAYVSVPTPQGELLNVAMYTRAQDATGIHDYVTLGASIAANYWKTGFTTEQTATEPAAGTNRAVLDFAFFVDVKRPSGEIDRLWQSDHGANFTTASVFSLPFSGVVTSGDESIAYASNASGLFDQKRACQ